MLASIWLHQILWHVLASFTSFALVLSTTNWLSCANPPLLKHLLLLALYDGRDLLTNCKLINATRWKISSPFKHPTQPVPSVCSTSNCQNKERGDESSLFLDHLRPLALLLQFKLMVSSPRVGLEKRALVFHPWERMFWCWPACFDKFDLPSAVRWRGAAVQPTDWWWLFLLRATASR